MLPLLDQIVTDYSTDQVKKAKRLSVALHYTGDRSYGIISLRDAIASIYLEIAKNDKQKAGQMFHALIGQVKQVIDEYSPMDDKLTPKIHEWKEYLQFIMVIQFYLGNSAGFSDPPPPVYKKGKRQPPKIEVKEDHEPLVDKRGAYCMSFSVAQEALNQLATPGK